MPENTAAARALDILMERVRWEASEFEEDVEGDPFLPDATNQDAQERFTHFSVDLEKFVGCDRASLGMPLKPSRPCLLYHASWMSIPGRGMLLDSFGRFAENKEVPADHRANLLLFVEGVRKVIDKPSRSSPMPRFFGPKAAEMSAGHMFIKPPFLLILYASGKRSPNSSEFYNLVNGVFVGNPVADGALIKKFEEAIDSGGRHAFYALHYATLPSQGRRNQFAVDVRHKIEPIIDAIVSGTHPLQTELGRDFVEAVTVHFQRQWGDRQEYQRKLDKSQRALESNISHDLCRNLYYTIGLLDQGQGFLHTSAKDQLGNVGRFLEAADETVRACFAAPYLSRRTRKGDKREVWQHRDNPVSEAECLALVAMFDRKLIAICDAERPLRRHVEIWREYLIDGARIDHARLLDLGDAPGDWKPETRARSYSGWPFADRDRESTIDNQGRQAILFGPQSELVRNAIETSAKFTLYPPDDEAAAYGIHVTIDIASDGSKISGSVRNKYPAGQDASDVPDDFLDKFANMSEWLTAEFVEKKETFHVGWTLYLQGREDRAKGSGGSSST